MNRKKISTNNIAIDMVRGGRKIRFRPPKVCFLFQRIVLFLFFSSPNDPLVRRSPSPLSFSFSNSDWPRSRLPGATLGTSLWTGDAHVLSLHCAAHKFHQGPTGYRWGRGSPRRRRLQAWRMNGAGGRCLRKRVDHAALPAPPLQLRVAV
jgi:hypothetical protein